MSYHANDVPLCVGDVVLYDMYMYGVDVGEPDRYVRGRIKQIRDVEAELQMVWLTGRLAGDTCYVTIEYVLEVLEGLAPNVPVIPIDRPLPNIFQNDPAKTDHPFASPPRGGGTPHRRSSSAARTRSPRAI
jgi:hypothetical protein